MSHEPVLPHLKDQIFKLQMCVVSTHFYTRCWVLLNRVVLVYEHTHIPSSLGQKYGIIRENKYGSDTVAVAITACSVISSKATPSCWGIILYHDTNDHAIATSCRENFVVITTQELVVAKVSNVIVVDSTPMSNVSSNIIHQHQRGLGNDDDDDDDGNQ